MGATRNIHRIASEFRDRFRRRRVEKPRDVGYYKKEQVLIYNPRQTEKGIEADFVPPRLGTPLAPYADHIYAPALPVSAQQIAIYSLKKKVDTRTHEILLTEAIGFKFRRKIHPKTRVITRLTEGETIQAGKETTLKTFKAKCFVKGDKNPFTHGEFTVAITKKTG